MRQRRDAVRGHDEAGARGQEKRRCGSFHPHETDRQINDNPSDGAHGANGRKIPARVRHLLHGDRIGQRDRRKVRQTEQQDERIHRAERKTIDDLLKKFVQIELMVLS